MKLIFTKSKWEMWDDPLDTFLQRAKSDGYDAVEIYLPAQPESPSEIEAHVADHGLQLVAQITSEGETPGEHAETLRQRFDLAVATGPLLINSHTGSDVFGFDENWKLFRLACDLSREAKILLTHETHRGRPTFSGPQTYKLLKSIPELRLNADFSHWFCVHESDLSNQRVNVDLAIQRASHIHARVGSAESPQVLDPLAPVSIEWTERHLELWRRIIRTRELAGADFLTITPEFGPPPYMPVDPVTGQPLADAWEVNLRFTDFLKSVMLNHENAIGTIS